MGRDLTELRQLQQRGTLAELARGVAHDVNNALGAVAPLVEAVREDLEAGRGEGEELAADLREVERYVSSARRIFAGMLRVSRDKGFKRESVDVNGIVKAVMELLQGRLKQKGIKGRLELSPGLPAISASPIAVEQILSMRKGVAITEYTIRPQRFGIVKK